jgi:hypothetical protein
LGEKKVWSVVRVPTIREEDARQLHREIRTVQKERTRTTNRIRGLLANQGIGLPPRFSLTGDTLRRSQAVGWRAASAWTASSTGPRGGAPGVPEVPSETAGGRAPACPCGRTRARSGKGAALDPLEGNRPRECLRVGT